MPVVGSQGPVERVTVSPSPEASQWRYFSIVPVLLLKIGDQALNVNRIARIAEDTLREQFRRVIVMFLFRSCCGLLEAHIQAVALFRLIASRVIWIEPKEMATVWAWRIAWRT
jgi:hypothetical protein